MRTIKNCEFCDILFTSYEKKKQRFCSISCSRKWLYKEGYNLGFQKGHAHFKGSENGWFTKERVSGKKNVNWKGGVTLDRDKYPSEFRRVSKTKRSEDNFTCRVCEEVILEQTKDKHLIVHHIDEDLYNLNQDNLITLCNSCHRKVHHKTSQIPVVQEVV